SETSDNLFVGTLSFTITPVITRYHAHTNATHDKKKTQHYTEITPHFVTKNPMNQKKKKRCTPQATRITLNRGVASQVIYLVQVNPTQETESHQSGDSNRPLRVPSESHQTAKTSYSRQAPDSAATSSPSSSPTQIVDLSTRPRVRGKSVRVWWWSIP
ncbi:hypothetical protein L218DRAFT_385983, partial [Marasmius fiardii PR-910]